MRIGFTHELYFSFQMLTTFLSLIIRLPSSAPNLGIDEHIDLGIKYDPGIGIFGMDFYCCMSRVGGMRVAKRKRKHSRVGFAHRLTAVESKKWFIQEFEGVLNKGKPKNFSAWKGKKGKKK